MKFLIDADCPRSIGILLRDIGHDVVDIRDIDPSSSDDDIYLLIQKESFILVTRDTDFSNILRYPLYSKCGIILLRVHMMDVEEILSLIKNILIKVSESEFLGSLIVVRKGRIRIHKF